MKITAGMGAIDDYERLVRAGADEVFCGYVPYEWNKKYGNLFPLNRREVLYYNVQINSFSDMKILKKMVDVYKVPVSITFNYLYYLEEQYEIAANIIKSLINIGFNDFIIADIGLILYLKENDIKCSIHLSGECAEINRLSIELFNKLNISRYIFHRKNSIEDMKSCISSNKIKNLQYEAFILNERCHYTGAFCNSLHCDELTHLCKIPYHIAKVDKNAKHFEVVDRRFEVYYGQPDNQLDDQQDEDTYRLGSTGCGVCSLKRLQKAGVNFLKVVGRGNFIDTMERDVRNLKRAVNMLDETEDSEVFEKRVKGQLFRGKCSGECYY
jgi:collagenase-like PrtC family protease